MKSFCIKTNNKKIINYLLENFKYNNKNNYKISNKQFKIYDNVILHCRNQELTDFYDYFCEVLTDTIINFYETSEIKKIINLNYFYFSKIEQSIILKDCSKYLNNLNSFENSDRRDVIYIALLKYISSHKYFILDGFVQFRLREYKKILEQVVDTYVNNFIVEKEYNEFINLLKIYINSNSSSNEVVHLIYFNQESILLDNNKKIINFNYDISNTKYLSDISFSTNDFCLNTLLNILPKKIYIHLLDGNEDEFIKTLSSIFESRISFCNSCNLCSYYKEKHVIQKNK